MSGRRDWREHWRSIERAPSAAPSDALAQVGKTMFGEPVGLEMADRIADTIIHALDVASSDSVWDLGCGNGLLTERVAATGCTIEGFDVSPNLISDAREHRSGDHIRYSVADLTERGFLDGRTAATKAYTYEVIQHLAPSEWMGLLGYLADAAPGLVVFVGSVPDKERIRAFYDSDERWERYLRKVSEDTEQIGTWWGREEICEIAAGAGFSCEIRQQPKELYTCHYRFDAVLS